MSYILLFLFRDDSTGSSELSPPCFPLHPLWICHRNVKRDIARKVIARVQNLRPPGRFLEYVGRSKGGWVDAAGNRLLEKTCQALRERKWSPATACLPNKKATSSSASASSGTKAGAKGGSSTNPRHEKEVSKKKATNKKDGQTKEPDKKEGKAIEDADADTGKREDQNEAKISKELRANELTDLELLNAVKVGSRISIYWPLDKTYYSGTVEARKDKDVFIHYDDGEGEWLDLTQNEFKVEHAKGANEPMKSISYKCG